jgi:transposase InsO family protein
LNEDYGRYPWNEITRRIKAQVSAKGLDSENIPRLRTLHSRLIRYLPPERVLSTKIGREAAENKLGAYASVNLAEFPLQIDCHLMDIITVFDLDDMQENEKVVTGRPWLTVIKDWFSGRILASHISLYHPKASSAVFLTIMKACINYGLPRIIYADNGMVYRADLFIQGCHENGIRPMWARAYTGRDKAVLERWFRTLESGLIHYLEGTTMANPQERGDYQSEKEAKYSLEDIREKLEQFIVRYNETVPEGSTVSPKDRYVAGLSEKGVVPRQVPKESIQRFKISFMRVADKRRTIQKDGLRFLNMHYIPRLKDRGRLPRADTFGKSIWYDFRWEDSNIRTIFVSDEAKNDYITFLSSEIMSDPHFSPDEPVSLRAYRRVQHEKGVVDPARTLLHYSERDSELHDRASSGDKNAAKELVAEKMERDERRKLGLLQEGPRAPSDENPSQPNEDDESIPKGELGSGTRIHFEDKEGERDD